MNRKLTPAEIGERDGLAAGLAHGKPLGKLDAIGVAIAAGEAHAQHVSRGRLESASLNAYAVAFINAAGEAIP